jgi:hypothetical protein
MATMLEEYTIEEQTSGVRFFCRKDSMKMILVTKCFLFTVGNVCRVLRFITGSTNSLKDALKSHTMPNQVRKCLETAVEILLC